MNLLTKEKTKRIVCVIILIAMALISIFVIAKYATDPKNYTSVVQSIDDKKAKVSATTASAAAISVALAAIPGGAVDPIADQIMKLASYLMAVVCVLALEKSLLIVIGYLSFKILVPITCGLLCAYLFTKKNVMKVVAFKIIVFVIVIVSVIPISLKIGDMICESSAIMSERIDNSDVADSENSDDEFAVSGFLDKIKNGVENAPEYAKEKLNDMIDAVAVFVVAYCVIPLLVVVFVGWILKLLFGLNISMPKIRDEKKTSAENKEKQEI